MSRTGITRGSKRLQPFEDAKIALAFARKVATVRVPEPRVCGCSMRLRKDS